MFKLILDMNVKGCVVYFMYLLTVKIATTKFLDLQEVYLTFCSISKCSPIITTNAFDSRKSGYLCHHYSFTEAVGREKSLVDRSRDNDHKL